MAEDHASEAQRRALEALARSRCEYCRYPASIASRGLSVDHIIPRSQGGASDLANLALACDGCNNHKYDKTVGRDPRTGRGTSTSSIPAAIAGADTSAGAAIACASRAGRRPGGPLWNSSASTEPPS